jgi:hypothetical protein
MHHPNLSRRRDHEIKKRSYYNRTVHSSTWKNSALLLFSIVTVYRHD